MKHEHPKLVMVHWLDAEGDVGWEAPVTEGPDDLPICHSVGYMVRESEGFLTIAADYDSTNGHFNRRMKIPMGMVKAIYTLRVGKVAEKRKKRA